MKRLDRWISVLLCVCMLCTSVPLSFAEEEEQLLTTIVEKVVSEPVEQKAESAAAETEKKAATEAPIMAVSEIETELVKTPEPKVEATAEPKAQETPTVAIEAEPTAEAVASATDDPESAPAFEVEAESTVEPEVETTAEPEDDQSEPTAEPTGIPQQIVVTAQLQPDKEAVESDLDEFDFGYVKLVDKTELSERAEKNSEVLAELPRGAYVLVTERKVFTSGDRLKVAFDYEEKETIGWIPFDAIEPLTEEEIEDFCEEIEEPIFYRNNKDFPLPKPDVKWIAVELADIETPAPESTATVIPEIEPTTAVEETVTVEPEVTALPEGTAVPEQEDMGESDVSVEATASAEPEMEWSVETTVSPVETVSVAQPSDNELPTVADATVTPYPYENPEDVADRELPSLMMQPGTIPDKSLAVMQTGKFELAVGESGSIAAEMPEGEEGAIVYAVDAENIAAVDEEGNITALAAGFCTVTASVVDDAGVQEIGLYSVSVYNLPSDFELNISEDVLNVGDTAQLTVVLPEGTHGTAVFAAQNIAVADVAADGLVTAIAPGDCELKATIGAVTKSVLLKVYGAPASIELEIDKDSLPVGYTAQATVSMNEYAVGEVSFRSSNPSVATVDASGGIAAVSVGSCEIIADAGNHAVASASFQVVESVLDLNVKYCELAVGQSVALDYTCSDDMLYWDVPVYTSSNESVATVDAETGVIQAIAAGEAVITLTLEQSGAFAECYLSVKDAPTSIKVVEAPTTIGKGQITDPIAYELYAGEKATVGAVSFKSSNTKIAKVNSDGQLLGVKAGSATITLTTHNGVSASFKVAVKKAPSKLTISPTSATLAVGQSGSISYTLTKNTYAGMTFTSSDTGVIQVDNAGKVLAVGVGIATVKVATHNGLSKNCTITVNKAPENVTLTASATKLGVGMTANAIASVDTTSNISFAYRYWTDAPDVISVDQNTGLITALKAGSAKVFVETYNGVSTYALNGERVIACAQVNIVPKPEKIAIAGSEFNVIVGRIITLPVEMEMSDGSTECMTTYTLSTSNKKIAQVNDAGQVKGVKAGTATITLTTATGEKASCKVIVRAKPTKVVLNKSAETLGVGMTSKLDVRVYYSSSKYFLHTASDALGTGVFSSSDSNVVQVNPATGEMTAVAKGTATVTYTTYTGKSASCKIAVKGVPTVIGLNKTELKLGAGMSDTLQAVFQPDEMGTPVFTSSNSAVATVDGSGKVTAVSQGNATITVSAGEGVTASCEVRVVPKPEKVAIAGSEFNVIVGRIITLPVELEMSDGSTECMTTYTLSTSNKKIAQVNDAGQVKGVKAGTATITLTTATGEKASCKVIVRAKPTKVVLNKSAETLGVGMTSKLDVRVYYSSSKYFLHTASDALGTGVFSSSDSNVVQVNPATGEMTAVAKGTATVTYTTYTGKSASCKIAVKGVPTVIGLNKTELKLGAGMSDTLQAVFQPDEMGTPVFTSSNSAVATVDGSGKVTAVSQGNATITVSAGEGVMASCDVRVVPKPEKVAIGGSEFNVIVGRIITLPVEMEMSDGSTECMTTYTLSTSNKKIAQVNDAGQVKGVKAGTATITLTTATGEKASCKVIVRAKPTKVVLNKSAETLGVGMTSKLDVRVYYSSSKYFLHTAGDALGTGVFSSSDSNVVQVNPATGEMTAVAKGTATVTYTTYTGKSASCKIAVVGAPTSISLSSREMKLGEKMSAVLSASFNANEYGWLKYTSSNPSAVTVSENGTLNAVAIGMADITVTTLNGVSATCRVNVVPGPDQISLNLTSSNLAIKGKIQLNAVCTYKGTDNCGAALAYKSSNTKVAQVSEDGVVTGVKAGSATIRVMAQNGTYADCVVVVRKAPTKVAFPVAKATLGVGQSLKVSGTVYYRGGSCAYSPNDTSYVRLTVDDESVAALNKTTGEITGVSVGRTTLRLTTYNGKTAKCTLDVGPGPEWISLEEAILTMSVGENMSLTCAMSPGCVTTLTYTSSNPRVLSVVGSGVNCTLNALTQGTATVTVTSSNGETSSCQVTVMASPQAIEFEQDAISIGMNETVELPAVRVRSAHGECSQTVAYSVAGEAVNMPAPGVVTGVAAGTAVVTATTSNGLTAVCTVEVLPEPSYITIHSESDVIAVGDTTMLEVTMDAVGSYTFSVDDESVLEVAVGGEVTALKPGKATITATSYNGCSDSCSIQVLAVPESIAFDVDVVTLGVGMTRKVTASIPEDTLGIIAYSSSDTSKVTVDAKGNITAVSAGRAVVHARIAGREDIFDTCEVTVLAKPTAIELSATEISLRKGSSTKLTAEFVSDAGADCYGSAIFETSAEKVAVVSEDGIITAMGAGEADITVSLDSDRGMYAVCKVFVTESSVGFEADEIALCVGESYALRVDLPEGESNFSLTSSDTAVATVDIATRTVTALAEGEATIIATNGSDQAICVVRVTRKPDSIQLSETRKKLVIGKSFELSAMLLPEGSVSALKYVSSNESAVKVSADGLVEAVGYGTSVIRVSNYDESLTAECVVSAVYLPEQVRFGELSDIIVSVGDSYVLEAPVMYNAKGDCDATYTLASSNAGCIDIAFENGCYVIRALSEGTAVLRLKTENGKTASCKVVVQTAPDSIHFDDSEICLVVGQKYAPAVIGDNGAVVSASLTSSDEQCVAVQEDGSLMAIAEGTAKIAASAKSFDDLTAEATVKVVQAPSVLKLSASGAMLAVGEEMMLTAIYEDGAPASGVDFISSDESIACVDRNGLIRAVGLGEATIRATTFNGLSAECIITVKAAPTALFIEPYRINACLADRVGLTASFGRDTEHANVKYASADPSVAKVDSDGMVTFVSLGETVITATTFNGYVAEVPVQVGEAPTGVRFEQDDVVILKNDTAQLGIVFDKGYGYFELNNSNPGVLEVTSEGIITALNEGEATISLIMPGLGLSAACKVTVVEELEGIALTAEKTTLDLHESTQMICTLLPANAIGTGLTTFKSSDPKVAEVEANTGVVTGISYGSAVITAQTQDGKTAECTINVLGGKRRMLVAYYFGEAGDPGYLPFAYNNGYSMTQAFSAATVEGQRYEIAGPMSNAPKATLLGAIDSHFADATDDDVSVIYICAHGSKAFGASGEYAFTLDSSHAVVASELMNRLEKIKGRVVLIMDSCFSGGVIDCNLSRLNAQGGRISILASSHRSTSSSYWYVSQKLTAIDFYTHALLQGVGFNESQGIGGNRGWFRTEGGPADDSGNGDGQITVQELFNYAKSVTVSNVAKYKGEPEFRGNSGQVPQSYIGSMNKDLVLFAR